MYVHILVLTANSYFCDYGWLKDITATKAGNNVIVDPQVIVAASGLCNAYLHCHARARGGAQLQLS